MPKDPALLWYWSDWRGGTGTFTRHLKGCYMDLLDAQFNSGPLSLEEIRTVLGADFGQAWPTLQKKFTLTDSGLYYNERMEFEKDKRKKFTESRRQNLSHKKPPQVDDHMTNRMGNHMDNENEKGNKEGGMGETIEPIGIDHVAKIAGEVWGNRRWVENVCMGQQLTPEALQKWMAQFNASICNDKMPGFSSANYQKLFGGWLNKQKSKGYSLNSQVGPGSGAPPVKKIAP